MNPIHIGLAVFACGVCLGGGASGQSLDGLSVVRDARTRRSASNSTDPNSNGDNRWVKAGETFTLAEIKGSGTIRHIWLTFAEAAPSWLSTEGSADPSEVV